MNDKDTNDRLSFKAILVIVFLVFFVGTFLLLAGIDATL